MAAFALKGRPGSEAWGARALLAVMLAGVWTLLAVDLVLGLPLPIPSSSVIAVVVLAFPFACTAAAFFGPARGDLPLRATAGWTVLVLAALVVATMLPTFPLLAPALPVLIASGLVCARYPAGAMALVVFLTGTYGTVEAFLPIPARPLVDLVLAGLWSSVLWGYLFGGRDRPVWLWPGVAVCIAYVVLTAGAMLGSESFEIGLRSFRATAWYMLAFLLIAYAGWSTATYHRIARAVIVVATIVGAYATFRWVVGPSGRELAGVLATDGKYEFVGGQLRVFGSFDGGKPLAAWTGTLIPFCLAFALSFKGRWSVLATAAAGLCGLALLGSEARAGFIGAVLGIALVLTLYQLSRGFRGLHLGVTAAALVAVVGVGVFLFTQTAGDDEAGANRYTRLVTEPTEDPAFQGRLLKWRTALEDIRENPLGQGLGSAGVSSSRFVGIGSSSIDSSYLKIAYEQGFGVMVLFIVGILLLLYGLARRALFTLDRQRAGLAIGAVGALAAFCVLMFSGTFIVGLPALATWMVIGLGVSQFVSQPREPHATAPHAR